ncbi:hypothetical protein LINPERHAP2_LOCUS17005 [Linum perenne]
MKMWLVVRKSSALILFCHLLNYLTLLLHHGQRLFY